MKPTLEQRLRRIEEKISQKRRVTESTRLLNSRLYKILDWYLDNKPKEPIEELQDKFDLSEDDAYVAYDFIKEYLETNSVKESRVSQKRRVTESVSPWLFKRDFDNLLNDYLEQAAHDYVVGTIEYHKFEEKLRGIVIASFNSEIKGIQDDLTIS